MVVYAGLIPLDKDLLNTNIFATQAIGNVARETDCFEGTHDAVTYGFDHRSDV
jgi:hypothetical protein